MGGITVGTRDTKCSLIVVATGTHAVDKVGQQVNGFTDTVGDLGAGASEGSQMESAMASFWTMLARERSLW